MHEQPEVKELVFNCGGARGAGMAGVYYALKTTVGKHNISILDNVESIAGTSVGSLTAAVFAVGPECDELKTEIFDKNILNILKVDTAWFPINLSLEPLEVFINNFLHKHIKNYLQDKKNLDSQLLNLLTNLNDDNYQITFMDLNLLKVHNPKKFKNLIITSTASSDGVATLNLYNYSKTPEFAIAKACAASCAVLPSFKPVYFGGKAHFDGGYSEPLPSEYFSDSLDRFSDAAQAKRLLFVFGPGPSLLGKVWQKTIHGKPNPELVFNHSLEELKKKLSQQDFKGNDELQKIHVWIDNKQQKVFYKASPADIMYHFTFSELNIDVNNFKTANPNDNSEFYKKKFAPYLVQFYTKLVHRKHLNSVLGDSSPIWLLNYLSGLIKLLLGFPIYIATLFESLCQRLKTFYALNTIFLNSTLQGHSFKQGEKLKRTIAAIYYLDTMNHLALYNYANHQGQYFYLTIVHNYLLIYPTLLNAANIPTNIYIESYKQAENSKILYEIIKQYATENPTSWQAQALTLAVELYLQQITIDEILAEINEKAQAKCKTYSSLFHGHKYNEQSELSLSLIIYPTKF